MRNVSTIRANKMGRIEGLPCSTWLALVGHARICTRAMGKVIESRPREGDDPTARHTWHRSIFISQSPHAELCRFENKMHLVGQADRPFREDTLSATIDRMAGTDASDHGFGGWIACMGDAEQSQLVQNIKCAKIHIRQRGYRPYPSSSER